MKMVPTQTNLQVATQFFSNSAYEMGNANPLAPQLGKVAYVRFSKVVKNWSTAHYGEVNSFMGNSGGNMKGTGVIFCYRDIFIGEH